jgi:hypothetical protein
LTNSNVDVLYLLAMGFQTRLHLMSRLINGTV